jgi:replicative DNA helicase
MALKNNRENIIPIDLGKIPPQCVDLEQVVLGAIMIEKDSLMLISNIITPESFYKESHQKIFQAIVNLSLKHDSVDILTVTEELKKLGCIEEIGGPYYIVQLTGKIASAAHIETHARIIAQKYLQRQLIKVSTDIQQQAFDDNLDIDDLLEYAMSELNKINNGINIGEPKTLNESVRQALKNLQEREILFKQGKSIGIRTPNKKLTKWTSGWLGKQFILIASRPGCGKTAYALQCAKVAAIDGYKPCIFSLEMDNVQLVDRLLVGESQVPADNYKLGDMTPSYWNQIERAVPKLETLNILIDDIPKSIYKIKASARNLKRKGKCDLIIIDYIQLSELDDPKKMNREQVISTISRECKIISMELGIPVIALSQLNREVEKRSSKVPTLSDLRESGALEQDPDIVLFLNRPEMYGITEDAEGNKYPPGYFEIIIAKHRGGKLGTIPSRFNESLTSILDEDDIILGNYNPNLFTEPNTNFDNERF